MRTAKLISFYFLFLLFLPTAVFSQFHDADWLEQGLLAEFQGEYEEALEIWMDARSELESPDSRIGFEYIRLVTEQDLTEYYREATEMYLWAVSSPYSVGNRAAIRQEIERLRPIIGNAIYRQWISWFEERDDRLTSDIRGFWIQMDPTPGEQVNERLIEHWNRIAHARNQFVKNSNTIYGTDDRAMVFIRYGEPDRTKKGTLTLDNQNIGRWLATQFESADLSGDPKDNPLTVIESDNRERRDGYDKLEKYVFRFHQNPDYEIWVYKSVADQLDEPLLFIFGTDAGTGEFKLQKSVDDFIPQRAYLSDRRSLDMRTEFVRQGLTPALALQLLYYEQLKDVDPFFEDRLNLIRESFIDQGPLAYRSLDLSLRSQNRERLEMRTADAPLEISSNTGLLPHIPVEIHQYRFLDEDLNPKIISFFESRPAEAVRQNMERIRADRLNMEPESSPAAEENEKFRLHHKLLIYDSDWNELEHVEDIPPFELSGETGERVVQSVFKTEHNAQNFQSAIARLNDLNPDTDFSYSPLFPKELIGLGTIKNQQPQPLSSDPERLEMADLILGYHDSIPEDYPFSFRVANDQTIPSEESLMLHFAVYNLEGRANGITHFELTYRIYPVDEEGRVLTDAEEFYLTINFEQEERHVAENLEIQTSELSSGLYELQVMVMDMESEQEQRRDIRFEVTN